MKGPPVKITIDPDDIITDAITYYKTPEFDGSKKLKITFIDQPGVDTGGLSRQFFSDAIEAIAESQDYMLFEGPDSRRLPAYNSTSAYSGLFEVLGRLIGHSILQSAIGYPCLALPVYWYMATGDMYKALSYVSIIDVRDAQVKDYIEKVQYSTCLNLDCVFVAVLQQLCSRYERILYCMSR